MAAAQAFVAQRADRGAMPFQVDDALRYVVQSEGSDLHLKVGAPPMTRIHGALGADPRRSSR